MTACPGCSRPMRPVELSSTPAESAFACPYCSGVLILADALSRAVGRALGFGADPAAERRSCPSCAITMSTEKADDVVVDRCPGCQRVFLDAGELEHLARRPLFVRKPAKQAAQFAEAEADFKKAQAQNKQRPPGRLPRSLFGVRRGSLFDFNE